MTAVQDIQELEAADQATHGADCFCQLCKPQIVDEQTEPDAPRIFVN